MRKRARAIDPGSTLLCLVALGGCGGAAVEAPPVEPEFAAGSVARFVDPFIGTGNDGNTFPGAVRPWGMVSTSPHDKLSTPIDYLNGRSLAPSGYVDGEPRLMGFGGTHLSGVGCPELGAPVIAPTVGDVGTDPDAYSSAYAGERAWAGYYRVELTDFGVRAEMTAGRRAGSYRFRFPSGRAGDANVLIDAGKAVSWRGGGQIAVVSPSEAEGFTDTGLFCAAPNKERIFFVVRLSRAADHVGTWKDGAASAATEASGRVGAFFRFSTGADEPSRELEVRFGVSFTSVENARANLDDEERGAGSFDDRWRAALADWEKWLGRVRVGGGTDDDKTTFYTALYHAMIHPSLISDASGDRPVFGATTVKSEPEVTRYHVFSLWDTYRTVHPLDSLLFPEMQTAFARSIADMTMEAGAPPVWELAGQETHIMVGDPAIIVLGDSIARGVGPPATDGAKLYDVLRAAALDITAMTPHRPGNADFLALGYVPIEDASAVWGPVSTTLEYGLADWNLARMAAGLGRTSDQLMFDAHGMAWRNVLDSSTGFLRPRHRDGSYLDPFDPDALTGSNGAYKVSGGPGYVEGTAWHYNFAVPHDPKGLARALGGDAAFVARLQSMFDDGKFVMWNEPDIAYPYLFTWFSGEAHRTQKAVADARATYFTTRRDGIPGNDDAGTMSAWFVFSALGFYPDCPGSSRYRLGTPLFDRAEIDVGGGTTFVIDSKHASRDAIYVGDSKLDGVPLDGPWIDHARIVAGGTLTLTMSATPSN